MNGPNKTVAAARNRKTVKMGMRVFNKVCDAENFKAELVGFSKVVVKPFKMGPRKNPYMMYGVHWYQNK